MNFVHIRRSVSIVLALCLALAAFCQDAFAKTSFPDVDTAHPAYESIMRITDLGLMSGDSDGNFNPDGYIDKFETAMILALIAGYKTRDCTEEEKAYFDKSYEKNSAYLNHFAKTYARWNPAADRQIAYLLEEKILSAADLKEFVGIRSNDTEGVRALTNEEAAVFITKAAGKKDAAASTAATSLYADDSKISAAARPYVYYLKSVNVMTGGANNSFNPRSAITRADFAVLLDKILTFAEIELEKTAQVPVGENGAKNTPAKTDAADNDGATGADSTTDKTDAKGPDDKADEDGKGTTGKDETKNSANSGEYRLVRAKITSIRLTENASYITLLDNGAESEYKINPERIDVYALIPGSTATVMLNSSDALLVYDIDEVGDKRHVTGYVISKREKSVIISNFSAKTSSFKEIFITDDTIFTDLSTGTAVSYDDVPTDAKIYIYLDESLTTALYVSIP